MEQRGTDYRRRLTLALAGSMVLHLISVTYVAVAPTHRGTGVGPILPPIIVDLAPREAPLAHVDTAVGTEEAVDPQADLISDKNAKASDFSDVEGTRAAPFFAEPSNFDEMRAPSAGPAMPPPGAPQPEQQQQATPGQDATQQTPAEEATEQAREASGEAKERQILRQLGPPRKAQAKEPPAPANEQMQMAKAGASPEAAAQAPQPSQQQGKQQPEAPATPGKMRGRIDGGVKNLGFLGFEAKKNEFAPYLKIVRERVESRWYRALELKYSGTSKTEAIIDCSISPSGTLIYVEIVEAGPSATYAHLCKEAIERAAPFPPFPFEVPAVYRSKNLDIRWTFTFM